jgi:Na+-driven multidrug efflux pump
VLAVLLGVVTTVVLLVAAPVFVGWMGASTEVGPPAVDYLRIRALATPAVLMVLAGHGAFRGHHDTRTPLYVALLVNGVNIVLDPLFIFGFGWGLEGAAVATVLALWLGAMVFLRLLVLRSMVSRPRDIQSALPTLFRLGKDGALVSLRTGALLVAFTVAAFKATRLGAEQIAAHQVVAQVWLLAAMVADAFAITGQVMVGDGVGKQDESEIKSVSANLMIWGVGVGLLLLVIGVNIVLDPLFIFGFGWGLEGAAVATVLAQWLGAIVFLRLLASRSMVSRPRDIQSALPTLFRLGKDGALVSLRTAALLVAFTVAASKATRLGAEQIAAHQVVAQVWLLAAMVADAFAITGQVMVGDAVGKQDESEIKSVSANLMIWGVGVGLLLLVTFWAGRGLLASLSSDPTVGALAVEAGGVAALMQPLAAPLFVADGIFLGLLALGVLVASTATGSALGVGLMLFSPLGDSLSGIWWALAAMVVARLVVFAFSYTASVRRSLTS